MTELQVQRMKEIMVFRVLIFIVLLCFNLSINCSIGVAQSAASLLADNTKGFFCIRNVAEFQNKWAKTQLGVMAADPQMDGFASDLQKQLQDRMLEEGLNISITWDEIQEVCRQELCFALMLPDDGEGYAVAMVLDVTGNVDKAKQLVEKIDANLIKKGSKVNRSKHLGQDLVVHELPRRRGQLSAERVSRFMARNRLVVCNHETECTNLLSRVVEAEFEDSISSTVPFQQTVEKSDKADVALHSDIQWFIEPFGFAKLIKEARQENKRRGKDMLAIVRNQGFDAVKGIGGVVHVATKQHEFLYRTSVFAPPVEGAEPGQKYKLAARMLKFLESKQWTPDGWLPIDIASHASFYLNTQDAFNYSASLVNAVAGDPSFFDSVLDSIKTDPNGPKIDIREEFIRHLKQRVVVITDQTLPVDVQSERMLVAIDAQNSEDVANTLKKAFEKDPTATKQTIHGHTVWVITPNDEEEDDEDIFSDFDIENLDTAEDEEEAQEVAKERLISSYAITVANGAFLFSSHLSFLEKVLAPRAPANSLAANDEFNRVQKELTAIGANSDSMRQFALTDVQYQTNYELFRHGKMPESESMLGKVLNRILSGPNRDVGRKQRLNGEKLPEFEKVRKYFGPAGFFMKSEENGWSFGGLLLKKSDKPEEQLQVRR